MTAPSSSPIGRLAIPSLPLPDLPATRDRTQPAVRANSGLAGRASSRLRPGRTRCRPARRSRAPAAEVEGVADWELRQAANPLGGRAAWTAPGAGTDQRDNGRAGDQDT